MAPATPAREERGSEKSMFRVGPGESSCMDSHEMLHHFRSVYPLCQKARKPAPFHTNSISVAKSCNFIAKFTAFFLYLSNLPPPPLESRYLWIMRISRLLYLKGKLLVLIRRSFIVFSNCTLKSKEPKGKLTSFKIVIIVL